VRHVLILGPAGEVRAALQRALESSLAGDGQVETFARGDDVLAWFRRRPEALPLVILQEGFEEGLDFIRLLTVADDDVVVVAAATRGDVNLVARAIRAGARDFLVVGGDLDARVATLLAKLAPHFQALARTRSLTRQNERLRDAARARAAIIGSSPPMRALIATIQRIAAIPRPVLIRGERGTGKELVARAIHHVGMPAGAPIVTVNCAAYGDALLESELFGHERGAFTGADATREGRFEQAHGGTLFLDEIGNMSMPFQQKILRVVEYGTFTRVGGLQERRFEARIIAATNADLTARIEAGTFLSDLYDRLAFEVIEVPPLRARAGDVEVLAHHFLFQFSREIPSLRGKVLSAAALEELEGYAFPGNVRELKNIIERAACRDTTNEITPEDLGLLPAAEVDAASGGFRDRVDAYARGLLLSALARADGNQAAAARALGLTYAQFRYHHRRLVGSRAPGATAGRTRTRR